MWFKVKMLSFSIKNEPSTEKNLFLDILKGSDKLSSILFEFQGGDGLNLENLTKVRQNMKKLHSLELILNNLPKITSEKWIELMSSLSTMGFLKNLRLDFSNQKINEMQLDSSVITNEAIVNLGSSLKKIPNLILSKFSNCTNITDEPFEDFAKGLASLGLLVTLVVKFTDCECITNSGLGTIQLAVNQLIKLETLQLTFRSCKNISTVNELSLQNLNSIKLDFLRSHNADIMKFLNILFKLKSVKVLNLNLSETNIQDPETLFSKTCLDSLEDFKLDCLPAWTKNSKLSFLSLRKFLA